MKDIAAESLNKNVGDDQIYELGYHLLPTILEEEVPREISQIHSLISEYGGSVIAEGAPIMRSLAYEISKRVETKSLKFNKAYFGWIKLETDRSKIIDLKNKLESLPNILRFLIIKTVRENTMYTPKIPMFKKENNKEEAPLEITEKIPASEAEMDKSIDELIIGQ